MKQESRKNTHPRSVLFIQNQPIQYAAFRMRSDDDNDGGGGSGGDAGGKIQKIILTKMTHIKIIMLEKSLFFLLYKKCEIFVCV